MSTRAAIVDGNATGILLAPEFRRRGVGCIHVQSAERAPQVLAGAMAFRPEDYAGHVVHRGDLADTVGRLLDANGGAPPLCAVAGNESGVEVADALSHALSLPGNDPANAPSRRDKYEMVRALQRAGLRTIPTCKTRDVDDALRWIAAEGGGYPAVVKPPRSFSTDGVTLCADEAQVRAAFGHLLGRPNLLEIVNHDLVVQQYIRGNEYIVDLASRDGRHCVTDIWLYGKRLAQNGASFVYDHAWLLPRPGELQDALCAYAEAALDAVGIRFGAAHCEVMVDERGPVLIEVGARLCGGMVPRLCTQALGTGQLEATVDAFVDRDAFDRRLGRPYALTRQALRVLLISEVEGELRELPRLDDLARLPSFHDAQISVRPGDRVDRTTNFYTHPGKVDLIHPDRETLASDMGTIRRWEADDFYRLAPTR